MEPFSRSYRKPTQVGGVRILRRVSEFLSRNSASWCCNFGRRCALLVMPLAGGAKEGCSDQAVATVYQKHRTLLSRQDDV